MDAILKDINAVVGVTGCFVCDDEGRVLAHALSGIFDANTLSPVGRTVAQTIAGLETTNRRKVGDIDLLYDQGRMIVKNLGEGCLCILCVRRINVPLLNLTANVAAKKLGEKLKASRPVQTWVPAKETPAQAAPAEPPAMPAATQPASQPEPTTPPEPPKRPTRAEILAASLRR